MRRGGSRYRRVARSRSPGVGEAGAIPVGPAARAKWNFKDFDAAHVKIERILDRPAQTPAIAPK